MWRKLDYYWLQFLRFGASVDLYLAERSGNREMRRWATSTIDTIDRELTKWAINH